MPDTANKSEQSNAEQAMNAAVHAEQTARQAIEECERQAAARIERVRQRARRILENTDRRIGELHLQCATSTTAHVDHMLKADADNHGKTSRPELQTKTLEAAVQRLAAKLAAD